MRWRVKRRTAVTIVLGLGAACTAHDATTGPGGLALRPPLQADWTPGTPIGQAYTLSTPQWNTDATPFEQTGITIPAGVPVRVRATGMLDFTVNQGFVACYGSPPPPLPGGLTSVGPAGFPSPGGWGMVVRLDSQPTQYALTSPVAGSDTATV